MTCSFSIIFHYFQSPSVLDFNQATITAEISTMRLDMGDMQAAWISWGYRRLDVDLRSSFPIELGFFQLLVRHLRNLEVPCTWSAELMWV